MSSLYTPKQIASMLLVSTTTLRKYEELDLIPDVPRTKSNRRSYTSIHLQAFTTIRALLQAYSVNVAYDIMRKVKQGHKDEALWLINKQQYNIQLEKMRVESIVSMLQASDFSSLKGRQLKEQMSIGEAAAAAGVNASAIRHWEKEGLIQSERNPDNGYRVFSPYEIRKILIISSLRKTIYFIGQMKQLLNDLDNQQIESVEKSFQSAFQNMHKKLNEQYQAAAQLVAYLNALELEASEQ